MKKFITLALLFATLALVFCSCFSTTNTVTIKRGETTSTLYKNEAINVTFTKPTGWRFCDEDELANLMNSTKEVFKDEELFESAEITTVIEFMAINDRTGENVNLTIENLKSSRNDRMTIEEYAQKTMETLNDQLEGSYEFNDDIETVTLNGEEYLKLTCDCKFNGVSMKQFMYMKKVGHHVVCITATSTAGTTASEFEEMFS